MSEGYHMSVSKKSSKQEWSVYLLHSQDRGDRTYIGCTTDPDRRLRQHNREISGGARATHGRQWKMILYVSGFTNKSDACRWEKLAKSRARGLTGRIGALIRISHGICPPGRTKYVPPANLRTVLVVGTVIVVAPEK